MQTADADIRRAVRESIDSPLFDQFDELNAMFGDFIVATDGTGTSVTDMP